MYSKSSLFLLLLVSIIKNSIQTCSSTVAITTCTWDSLNSPKPLRIAAYKPYLSFTTGDLERVPREAFKFLEEVTILQLGRNKIQSIEEGAFEGLKHLKQLKLNDNRLTSIERNALKHCTNLENLDLSLNKISSIDGKAFEHVSSKLTHLNLAFNSLKEVPEAIKVLANLQVLRLDNNQITALSNNAFLGLEQLQELQLNDNKLSRIEQNSFKSLGNLQNLDLRGNFLTEISVEDLVRNARNLKRISLSLNEFKCDRLKDILQQLERRNVEVSRGVSRSPSSLHGISCKNKL